MVALGCQMWKTKRVPDPYGSWQKTFSKDEVWQTDFARPLQCYSVFFFFFFIQPCLRPWNSDCSWSPCSWHSFPATKLNTGTIYSLSFYQEVNTFRWNGKKKMRSVWEKKLDFYWTRSLVKPSAYLQSKLIPQLAKPLERWLVYDKGRLLCLKTLHQGNLSCPMPLNRTYLTSLQP